MKENVIEFISIPSQKPYFKEYHIQQSEVMSNEEGYSFGTFQNATQDTYLKHIQLKYSTILSVKELDVGL